MAKILKETKSTGSSPSAYYTVNASASDRTVNTVKVNGTIDSRLSSSNASLGAGGTMGLIAYLKFNDKEYSVELKKTTEKWSGTTTHTKSFSFTIKDLDSSQSQLSDIKFRVSRTGSAADNYTKGAAMSPKSCSNLQIGIGHTNPSDVSFTITEKNQKLINAGITNNIYVNNLSIKEYNVSATLHDGASIKEYCIINRLLMAFSNTVPFQIDYSSNEMALWDDTAKVPIRVIVEDSLGGSSASSIPTNPDLYDYIPYTKINLNESQTVVKRNGQLSGKVKLNVNGTFYNGNVGNVTQTKPTIKYKYWSANDTEPATFDNTIPSDNIIVSENNFSVSEFEIGSIDETASNYFNPENAYRVKVYVEDNFTSYSSTEKPISVGEYTWAEYKDRVDFKRITKKGNDIIAPRVGDIVITSANVNPSEDYGGTWELIDKEFTPKRLSGTTLFTNNSTNTKNSSCYCTVAGHTVTVQVGLTNKVAITDTELNFGTFKLANIGITAFNNELDFTAFTDGGNCAVFMTITTAGALKSVDIIPDNSVAAERWIDGYATFTITPDNMLDSACNKFYWKKTT